MAVFLGVLGSWRTPANALLAEREGFEPSVPTRSTTVFETVPIDRSGTSPSGTRLILRPCPTRQHASLRPQRARRAAKRDRSPPHRRAHSTASFFMAAI